MKTIHKSFFLQVFLTIIAIAVSFWAGWQMNDAWKWFRSIDLTPTEQIDTSHTSATREDSVSSEGDPELVVSETDSGSLVEVNAIVTAYTTSKEENTTCISASGKNLCYYYEEENFAACPTKYPFSVEVEIQGIRYTCVDRMAKSLQSTTPERFDLYMGYDEGSRDKAFDWGRRNLKVKVYGQTN